MSPAIVVSNSSPLIALEQIGRSNVLQQLFTAITIPTAVHGEVAGSVPAQPWLSVTPLRGSIPPSLQRAALGACEREALALALELKAALVILDDRLARSLAKSLGLPVVGTLGILLDAKRKGHVALVQPLLDLLVKSGFWIAPALQQAVLSRAGETP